MLLDLNTGFSGDWKVVWYFHLLKNFQFVVIYTVTVKGFIVVSEAEVDVFLALLCFLYSTTIIRNLISDFSAFSKPSLYIWKFLVHVLLKPSLKEFEHNLTSMGNEHSCIIVWTFFKTAFLWNWNENWSLQVLWPLLSFPNLLAYLSAAL